MDIIAEKIKTADGAEGYLARPKDGSAPGLLIHFEIFGVNDHIQDVCRRFAAEGYAAFAPDYYWREQTRTIPYAEVKTAFGMANKLKDSEIISDAASCIRHLRAQPFVKTGGMGTVGFCMGGRISILVATQLPAEIGAAVSFYGGGLAGEPRFAGLTMNTMDEAPKLKAPVLLFYGALDKMITHDLVDRFTGRLKELAKGHHSFVYPGADHGFFCNERPTYNAHAAADAWQKSLDFLKANL
ncbi:MAG: dienelactone hydrolase family protein [Acidobacteria bacterium]|nr:dienelactone hydrolase family protein [Acidobacteriota bacterium]